MTHQKPIAFQVLQLDKKIYFLYSKVYCFKDYKEKMAISREALNDYLNDLGEPLLLMDGFDEAFIGISQRINEPLLAVYSYDKMVDLLVTRDGMEDEDAMEFIEYNCIGAWVGERTPIIVRSPF
jgi:hypothetical protein